MWFKTIFKAKHLFLFGAFGSLHSLLKHALHKNQIQPSFNFISHFLKPGHFDKTKVEMKFITGLVGGIDSRYQGMISLFLSQIKEPT